jgi:pyridoxamine 5'-phosphate oxidase
MPEAPASVRDLLRGLDVFPAVVPVLDAASAPGDPVTLFLAWLQDAIANKVLGPHAMTLATTDAAGHVSARVLLCKDVDADGRWYFASSSRGVKGRQLAASPGAALLFYWPQLGRQVRISGTAAPAGSEASAADFLARSPAARAEALTGRQSEPLADPAELDEALHRTQAAIAADPGLVAADWTLYALTATEAEFWQADHARRHTRLRYQRTSTTWAHQLLWP